MKKLIFLSYSDFRAGISSIGQKAYRNISRGINCYKKEKYFKFSDSCQSSNFSTLLTEQLKKLNLFSFSF